MALKIGGTIQMSISKVEHHAHICEEINKLYERKNHDYHMGAFTDKEEWQDYTRAIHRYPNVLWTHQADMIAAHIKGL